MLHNSAAGRRSRPTHPASEALGFQEGKHGSHPPYIMHWYGLLPKKIEIHLRMPWRISCQFAFQLFFFTNQVRLICTLFDEATHGIEKIRWTLQWDKRIRVRHCCDVPKMLRNSIQTTCCPNSFSRTPAECLFTHLAIQPLFLIAKKRMQKKGQPTTCKCHRTNQKNMQKKNRPSCLKICPIPLYNLNSQEILYIKRWNVLNYISSTVFCAWNVHEMLENHMFF